jgi:hypothetical protein
VNDEPMVTVGVDTHHRGQMITATRRWKDRLATLTSRYLRWEERRTRRIRHWSMKKRWLAFVLVPVVVLCCGGVVVGAPVLSLLRITLEASRWGPGMARGPGSASLWAGADAN